MRLKVRGLNQAGVGAGGMRKGAVRRAVLCTTEETEGRWGWHGGLAGAEGQRVRQGRGCLGPGEEELRQPAQKHGPGAC